MHQLSFGIEDIGENNSVQLQLSELGQHFTSSKSSQDNFSNIIAKPFLYFYMKSCQTIKQFQLNYDIVHDELFYSDFSELSHF